MGCGASSSEQKQNNNTSGKQQQQQHQSSGSSPQPAHAMPKFKVTRSQTNGKEFPTLVGGDDLVFAINGRLVELPSSEVDPTVKLAHYLREEACLKGTKIGCGEGGCGACAVLLSHYDPTVKKVVSTSANACLRPLVTMHGYHVTTVEGIGGPNHKDGFHALQKRFAQLNASQCGFCTPGFVVSVYSQLAKDKDSTMVDIENSLDGNLCRCTGYRPIMDAGKSFAKDSNVKDEIADTPIPNDQLQVQAEIDAMFPPELKKLKKANQGGSEYLGSGVSYYRPHDLQQARSYLEGHPEAKLVCAQTSAGVYKEHLPNATNVCDVSYIDSLRSVQTNNEGLEAGSVTPISTFIGELMKVGEEKGGATKQCFHALATIFKKIGNVHVRDVGSIGGNISMCKEQGFASDLVTPLCSANAQVCVLTVDPKAPGSGKTESIDLLDFVQKPTDSGKVSFLVSVIVPFPRDSSFQGCYRTAIRCTNAHAITNSGFHAVVNGNKIESVNAVFGVVGEISIPGKSGPKASKQIHELCKNKKLDDPNLVQDVCGKFEIGDFVTGKYKLSHRRRLVKAFFVQFIQELVAHCRGQPKPTPMLSTQIVTKETLHKSSQSCTVDRTNAVGAVGLPIPRPDGVNHASGSAEYVSDLKEPADCLHASWVVSRIAKGHISKIPAEVARNMPGVEKVITATDLPKWCPNLVPSHAPLVPFPGEWKSQPLFNPGEIVHHSQPVCMVLADTQAHAIAAAKKLEAAIEYTEEKPTISIDDAIREKVKPVFRRPCAKGNTWSKIKAEKNLKELRTTVEMESQKHWYMETHSVYASCNDHKTEVWVGNQFPMYIHKAVSQILGVPYGAVEIRNYRIGGSFGGKVSAIHACGTAVASKIMGVPVKLHLDRNIDSQMQGGREETRADLRVRFTDEGVIEHVHYDVWKTPGYFADSGALPLLLAMPHSLFLPYKCPNHSGVMNCMPTNIPPRSWCRGPGEIEAAFIQEEVIDKLAHEVGVHSQVIRERNMVRSFNDFPKSSDDFMSKAVAARLQNPKIMAALIPLMNDPEKGAISAALKDPEMGPVLRGIIKADVASSVRDALGDLFDEILGTPGEEDGNPFTRDSEEETNFTLDDMYNKLMDGKGWREKIKESQEWNEKNKLHKKGVAIVPLVYHMYVLPATALVNIYPDGSVIVHHGGVEMGQGLILKVLQAANTELSKALGGNGKPIDMSLFHSAGNNSSVLPLQSFTGGSTASENNVLAVKACCEELVLRLQPVIRELDLDKTSWQDIITRALEKEINLSVQHNSTADKDGDNARREYDCYCIGATQIDLDVLTGEVLVERFDLQYDSAKSMNPAVDIGQIEGALMMGLGYMLQEDTHLNKETGFEAAHGTWEYKPPFAINVPREFNVEMIHNPNFKKGIMSSKACGEPPLCVAPAITSAVHQAIQSARKDNGVYGFAQMSVPFTPWKVAEACGGADKMSL